MNHYELLGVDADADVATIRDAYRRLARIHHPDARGGRPSTQMAAINEAYGVLSDAQRRRDYDRWLRAGGSATGSRPAPSSAPSSGATASPPSAGPRLDAFGRYAEPPRFPWRFVAALALLGAAAVLVIGSFTSSGPPSPVDRVVQVGSCVVIDDAVGDVAEVHCTEQHDAVVDALVPFDATCPTGLETFRDRQGLGNACVRRVAQP